MTSKITSSSAPALPDPWPQLIEQASPGPLIMDYAFLQLWREREELRITYGPATTGPGYACLGTPQLSRILLGNDRRALRIEPRLAPRPVVTRPLLPTELLPRQQVTLFLSTPLYINLIVGEDSVRELPTTQLSDTWFGSNTLSGELCYATQTRARLQLEALADDPFRAFTAVTIVNQADDPLTLDRINVPVPNLSLYCDQHRFWTAALTITRSRDLTTAQIQIDSRPPTHSSSARLIADARREIRGGIFNRTVELLFA